MRWIPKASRRSKTRSYRVAKRSAASMRMVESGKRMSIEAPCRTSMASMYAVPMGPVDVEVDEVAVDVELEGVEVELDEELVLVGAVPKSMMVASPKS